MSDETPSAATGGCLCGGVQFEVTGPLRDVVICHCRMCRKLHGGTGPHSKARQTDLRLTEDRGLKWYASSSAAERGFCRECGSSLFWRAHAQDTIGILAGSFDQPTGLKTIGHIFVAEKADFDVIADDLPQFAASSDGGFPDDHL